MKNLKFIIPAFIAIFLFASCGPTSGDGKNYRENRYGLNPDFNVIEMQTYNPESEFFTFRYDTTKWTLEEWEDSLNTVAIVHNGYEDKSCYILPGTMGDGGEEGQALIEGSLLTQNFVARTLDITNPAGILLMQVYGFEVGDIPYVFEVYIPSKDPQTCKTDALAVVSAFNVYVDEPEEEDADEDDEDDTEDGEESDEGDEDGEEDENLGEVTVE